MNEQINNIFNKLKSPKLLIIAGVLGIILIFISSLGTQKPETKEHSEEAFSISQYKQTLEKDIKTLVAQITGSNKVSVVITLESSINYSYADTKEESSASKTEKEESELDYELKQGFITVKNSDGSEQALLVTAQMPEIRGVAIVCEGGDNEITSEKIESAITAALNITSKRVYICGRKQ